MFCVHLLREMKRMDANPGLFFAGWLTFARNFKEEPGAALRFIDPVFEEAGRCYVAGVVA